MLNLMYTCTCVNPIFCGQFLSFVLIFKIVKHSYLKPLLSVLNSFMFMKFDASNCKNLRPQNIELYSNSIAIHVYVLF